MLSNGLITSCSHFTVILIQSVVDFPYCEVPLSTGISYYDIFVQCEVQWDSE